MYPFSSPVNLESIFNLGSWINKTWPMFLLLVSYLHEWKYLVHLKKIVWLLHNVKQILLQLHP